MVKFRILIRSSRPFFLLFAFLTYTLGAGIAHYLGRPISLISFSLGLLGCFTLQIAAFLLVEYFKLPSMPLNENETRRQREEFKVLLLQVSAAALVVATTVVIVMMQRGFLSLQVQILFLFILLLLVAYAVPPIHLSTTGFGELALAFYFATSLPVLSFLIQTDTYHRLLTMTTLPLTLLALAYFLVLDFPTFAADQKADRRTLLTRMTWQRAIPIHHLLILAAFLILSMEPSFGFPWRLIWPVFLVLPFAGVQIYWLQRIASGGRTLWNFFTSLAAAVFGLTAYLLTFMFWIR